MKVSDLKTGDFFMAGDGLNLKTQVALIGSGGEKTMIPSVVPVRPPSEMTIDPYDFDVVPVRVSFGAPRYKKMVADCRLLKPGEFARFKDDRVVFVNQDKPTRGFDIKSGEFLFVSGENAEVVTVDMEIE